MPESEIAALFDRAEMALGQVARLLVAPNAKNLDRSRVLMETTTSALSNIRAEELGREWLGRALRVQALNRINERLLQTANFFYAASFQAVAGWNAGYCFGGRIEPGSRSGAVCVEF